MNDTERLVELIDTRFAGSQAAFARAISRQPAQVNQYIKGRRQLGIEVMMHIEHVLGIPGWFGSKHNPTPTSGGYHAPEPVAHNVTPISAHLAMAEASLESVMERLAAYLAQVPAADRGSSSAALAALAHQPEDHARKAAILRLLIDAPPLVHETATGTDHAQK